MKLLTFLKKSSIPLFFLCIGIALFFTNYEKNTYLMGWDNVMPEFNSTINVSRTLTAVWQEHRGLGLYDGMSHAANILHTLTTAMLAQVLPLHLVRYTSILGMYILGGIGAALLMKKILEQHTREKTIARIFYSYIFPLLTGILYLFNIATIQMIVVPLESFILHFAFLPFLLLTTINFLVHKKKKEYILLSVVYLLSSSQFFIPTLLFAVFFTVAVPCFIFILFSLKNKTIQSTIKTIFLIGLTFLTMNCYWLTPWLFGLPTTAPIIKEAKINKESSQEVFSQNQAYGDLSGVLFLRGFIFDQTEQNKQNTPEYLIGNFRNLYVSPRGTILSWVLVFSLCIGIGSVFLNKQLPKKYTLSVLGLFILGFFLLGTNIPILRDIHEWIRSTLPFVGEAYRFPFTKFILLFSLTYSVLATLGIVFIFKKINHIRYSNILSSAALLVFTAVLSLPAWQGYVFSPLMKVKLPSDYLQMFSYVKSLPSSERIALLPQTNFWSWKYYSFGYRGSGFQWYGIPQATLDRAFDPWSQTNEGYYWELNHAIYSKNSLALKHVLDKYAIRYILFDSFIQATAGNNRALFEQQTESLLSQIPQIEKIHTSGRLSLYEYHGVQTTSYIRTTSEILPTVYPTAIWFDYDSAFASLGTYTNGTEKSHDIYIPYRSFFSKRSFDENNFIITQQANHLTITPKQRVNINIPEGIFTATESAVINTITKTLTIDTTSTKVFTADTTNFLRSEAVLPCSAGTVITNNSILSDYEKSYLRISSSNGSVCLKFGKAPLTHRYGYIVQVKSRHEKGKPLSFTIIDETAKQNIVDMNLPIENQWITTYLTIPPRADDGLDFSFILSNKAIGTEETVNEISSIEFFQFPYSQLQDILIPTKTKNQDTSLVLNVYHPHAAYYSIQTSTQEKQLILYQTFNTSWKAYDISDCTQAVVGCRVQQALPFVFGKELKNHVVVNSWANGWEIEEGQTPFQQEKTIVMFFWPQLLQWFGFGLLIVPIVFAQFFRKRNTPVE